MLDEYRIWFGMMAGDDRFIEGRTTYRDLALLLQIAHVPITRSQYLVVEAVAGVVAALACLVARCRLGWTSERLVPFIYALGTFWMLLCGPTTESSTYILIAPLAAWLVLDACRGRMSMPCRVLVVGGSVLVHAALFSSAFPFGRAVHDAGLQPFGVLVMAIGYLIDRVGPVFDGAGSARTSTAARSTGRRLGAITMTLPLISIVCPAYNEELVLPPFHNVLVDVLAELADRCRFEILYVNDGSRDGTLEVLQSMSAGDPRVRWLSFSRNFGHQAALTAGMEHARGDAVITMDSDLQHPPHLIGTLIDRWREGFDVVLTVRAEDQTLSIFKRWSSNGFYVVLRWLSDAQIPVAAAGFRLLSHRAASMPWSACARCIASCAAWSTGSASRRPKCRTCRISGSRGKATTRSARCSGLPATASSPSR